MTTNVCTYTGEGAGNRVMQHVSLKTLPTSPPHTHTYTHAHNTPINGAIALALSASISRLENRRIAISHRSWLRVNAPMRRARPNEETSLIKEFG